MQPVDVAWAFLAPTMYDQVDGWPFTAVPYARAG
jgi:hypothetical protein